MSSLANGRVVKFLKIVRAGIVPGWGRGFGCGGEEAGAVPRFEVRLRGRSTPGRADWKNDDGRDDDDEGASGDRDRGDKTPNVAQRRPNACPTPQILRSKHRNTY
jgi:hypothetical protein